MAKPSSIPRKAFRANPTRKLPSSPLRAAPSAPPPQDLASSSPNLEHDGDGGKNVEQEDEEDDDFNPFTFHKTIKLSASAASAAQKKLNFHHQAESSLWLFDEDGRADSTNIMQGVAAPWGMTATEGDDFDASIALESPSKKKPQNQIRDSSTAPLPSSKIRILPPSNDLASSLLSPTHKLSRQPSVTNNLRQPLSRRRIPPSNHSATPSTSKSSSTCQPDQLSKSNSVTSNPQKTNGDNCTPSSNTYESLEPRRATDGNSAQPVEVTERPLPPSAIKKPRGTSVDHPKSVKKTRFIDLEDENLNQFPPASSCPLLPTTVQKAVSVVDQDDAPHPVEAQALNQDTKSGAVLPETNVTVKPAADLSSIPNSTNQPTSSPFVSSTFNPISEPTKRPPTTEGINLNSSPLRGLPIPLSPDRTLASRLQPSHPKTRSSRAPSVEVLSSQPTTNDPNQKVNVQNEPLSSFKRLSQTNSNNSKVFQTIQGVPNRASSAPNPDLLKPTRIIRNLAFLTGASEDDPQVRQASKSLGKPLEKSSESSSGIIKARTSSKHVDMPSEPSQVLVDEFQPTPPAEKLELFKRRKISNSRLENALPNGSGGAQEGIIPNSAAFTVASKDGAQIQQGGKSFGKPWQGSSESSGGIIEARTSDERAPTLSEQPTVLVENDCDFQPRPPSEKSESFKRRKVSNSRLENMLPDESEEVQEVKSTSNSGGNARNTKARSRKPTNRVHVSAKVGPRLSALIELPTPNSTVEAIGSADIEGIAMSNNDSMICQNGGVPQFSTPYSAGPISLPLPPDTHQLSASRPRRSARKSSVVRPSPKNRTPLMFEIHSSPPQPTGNLPIIPRSKTPPLRDSAVEPSRINSDLVCPPSTNVADCLDAASLKAVANSTTQALLPPSLNSNDSTNTTSSNVVAGEQDPGVAPVPPPKDAAESVINGIDSTSLIPNDAHPIISKKRSRMQSQDKELDTVNKAAETQLRKRSTKPKEPSAGPSLSKPQQPLQAKGQVETESLTSQHTEKQCEPSKPSATSEASEVAKGKRPFVSSKHDRAAATTSKTSRVPSSSTAERPRIPSSSTRVPSSSTRVPSSSTRVPSNSNPTREQNANPPQKPSAPQPRPRVTSETVRNASSSKLVAGTSLPHGQKPESRKRSNSQLNRTRLVVDKALPTPQVPEGPHVVVAPTLDTSTSSTIGHNVQSLDDHHAPASVSATPMVYNPSTATNTKKAILQSQSISLDSEPPISDVMVPSKELRNEIDKIPNPEMSAHTTATDLPARGRFTICLGAPSHSSSDFPVDDPHPPEPGPSTYHDAQFILPSDHPSMQLNEAPQVNLLSSSDQLNADPGPSKHRDKQNVISSDHQSIQPIPPSKTQKNKGANLRSSRDKLNSQSTSTQATSTVSKGPILTLPKEFAFTMRSTIPANPRIKDAHKPPETKPPTTRPKQPVQPTAKPSVPAPPKSKQQLVRPRPDDGDSDRATKRIRNNRPTVASPTHIKVGTSRPGVSNRVRNTVKRFNSLSKNVPTTLTMKKALPSSGLARGTSLQSSHNPPPAVNRSTQFAASTSQARAPGKTGENVPSGSKKPPVISTNKPVASKTDQSGEAAKSGSAQDKLRRLLMDEIRQRSKSGESPPGLSGPSTSKSVLGSSSTNKRKQSEKHGPLADTDNLPRSAPPGGLRRVVSDASSSKNASSNLKHELRSKTQSDKIVRVNSTGFQNRLNQWREVEEQQSLSSSTQTRKVPEWQDVSLVHHVLPVKDHSQPKKPAIKFGLATERRLLERENWEQIKAKKEKIEAEIRAQEEMKARELEREEFIKMRRECVVKANPVPEFIKKHR